MCVDPATMFVIATVASAGVQAYASVRAGDAAYQAGMYNAQIAERNAQAVEEEKKNTQDAAAIERRRLGERIRAEKGQKIADFAAMGLDTGIGTPADLVGDIEKAGRTDAFIIGRNEITQLQALDKQQADYRDSARLSRMEAKGARKAGQLGAVGSLLNAASTVSGRWMQPNSSTLRVSTAPHRPISSNLPKTSIFDYPRMLPVGGG